jgi:23S rRNA pseudouridine1911/1915/1917 synthase
MRLDKMMAEEYPGASRSFIQKMIADGNVVLNGRAPSKSERLKAGDEILIFLASIADTAVEPENIPLDIRYEDGDILVVNKPRGMVVHPAVGNSAGTLVNALLFYCGGSLSDINGDTRPGIVHRLDKDTSGLLIVAKNNDSHILVAEQIKNHSFKREYSAVVHGGFKELFGVVDAPIGRSGRDRKKMCVREDNSRGAVTYFEVAEELGQFTLLKLRLKTGRTHQIRVHMAHIGHPVAGDPVYGPKNGVRLNGQCLHAGLVGFIHPRDGRYIEVTSELPDYFINFLGKLRSL